MSKARIETCARKVAYYSFDQAREAATNLFIHKKEVVYPYICKICHNYHNGHIKDTRPLGKVGDYQIESPRTLRAKNQKKEQIKSQAVTEKDRKRRKEEEIRSEVVRAANRENMLREQEEAAIRKAERIRKYEEHIEEVRRTTASPEEKRFRRNAYMTWLDDGGALREGFD